MAQDDYAEFQDAIEAFMAATGMSGNRLADMIGLESSCMNDLIRRKRSAGRAVQAMILRWLSREWPADLDRPDILPEPDSPPAPQAGRRGFYIVHHARAYHVFDGEKCVSRAFPSRAHAEEAMIDLRRAAQRRKRACISCTATFISDGPHHRMCKDCRRCRSRIEYVEMM